MAVIPRGSNGRLWDKGYPTADITGIQVQPSVRKNKLKWTDPEDTIFDNAVLSEWESTIIVRKTGSAPQGIKDGIIIFENKVRNQYRDDWLEDANSLSIGETYHYRLFTRSKLGVINENAQAVRITATDISPVLAENPWAIISEVSRAGTAQKYWQVGDKINVTLTGEYAQDITLQIFGFDYDSLADGSGKAGITFGMKGLLREDMKFHDGFITASTSEWFGCSFRHKIVPELFEALPLELKNVIRTVTKTTYAGRNNDDLKKTDDTLFLLSFGEVETDTPREGDKYPIFTDAASKSEDRPYRLRTNPWNSTYTYCVATNGTMFDKTVDIAYGIRLAFCV